MKNNHKKWRLNRIAGALAVALLPLCDEVLARDVFNPALLEMDGPQTGILIPACCSTHAVIRESKNFTKR